MIIRNLSISTNIRIHPEFVTDPRAFTRRHNVDLTDDVFAQTDFKKDPDDPRRDERIEITKANIHLVRHGAIRLFTVRESDGDWLRSIDLNPSMLLCEAKRRLLAEGDLPLSLSILKDKVSPLLADPRDVQQIVPVPVWDDGEPVASWSEVDSEFLFPGMQISCLHGLSHPATGPADGATRKRIQFGDKQDDCVIRIKAAKWENDGPDGTQAVDGVRVRLILKGRALTDEFRPFGTTAKVDKTMRLVAFAESSIARVHQAVMTRMEGTFLPIPTEWQERANGKPLTTAKALALVAQLTSIPLEEIRAMDEEVRKPSDSTRERLDLDLPIEVGRLAPVPVATLFHPSAYAIPSSGVSNPADDIDPMIANAYGEK